LTLAVRDWLTARPIAHRGLHDIAAGLVENTTSAFRAAVAADYGIECDLQISADGEAMVYHDDALGRLTEETARLDAMTAQALQRVAFKVTGDRMLTLGELCDLVAGRVPLVIELKGNFDGDERLAVRAAQVLSSYRGPAALMSFDPGLIASVRRFLPGFARGLVGMHRQADDPAARMTRSAYIRAALAASPGFLAYRVADLASPLPLFARRVLRLPLLTWTVRTFAERIRASRYADQMIFEGFRP
jgi:glycerophosphoryl diester phosphodiesterase